MKSLVSNKNAEKSETEEEPYDSDKDPEYVFPSGDKENSKHV